jgi:hypothetical protein
MFRRRFLCCNAYAGQSTQQAIESIHIRLTSLGQVIDAAHLISERIGNPKARSRAERTAARIGHCHLHELRIRCHIANAAIRLSHEIPQYSGNISEKPLLTREMNLVV